MKHKHARMSTRQDELQKRRVRDVLERGSLADVEEGLREGALLTMRSQRRKKRRLRTPSRRKPLLRYILSPMTSLRSTLRSAAHTQHIHKSRARRQLIKRSEQTPRSQHSHLQGMLTTRSTFTFMKLSASRSTLNS